MRRKYSKVVLGFVCIHLTGTFCCVMRRHHRDIKASTIFAILQLISLCYILIPHDMSTTAVKKNDLILITGGFGFIVSFRSAWWYKAHHLNYREVTSLRFYIPKDTVSV